MLDRQKIEAILTRRFPGARHDAIAAAVNAIMGLNDEWEEVLHHDEQFGYHYSPRCGDICSLARAARDGVEFRLFRRRELT
jgi:hypothetical protein